MWTMLAIRSVDDAGDGILYPVPLDKSGMLKLDEADGADVRRFDADRLYVTLAKTGPLASFPAHRVAVHVTDNRVAVVCSEFDKGGPLIMNNGLIDGAYASVMLRSPGSSVVGHIRYPWLVGIAYKEKGGWKPQNSLRLAARTIGDDQKPVTLLLDVALGKGGSASVVAAEITRRAAAYRLERTRMDSDEERAATRALLDPPPLNPAKDEFATWSFPTIHQVAADTAFGNLAADPPG